MSDVALLLTIAFLSATTIFFSICLANLANNLGAQIASGVAQQGARLSAETRRVMLFHMWLPYESAGAALSTLIAIAALQVADQVSASSVRLLAHLLAFIGLAGLVTWVLSGTVCFLHYRSILRQAEAD